jgi:chromosome segregation ATPase
MANTEKFKVLRLAREAKDAVRSAQSAVKDADEAKLLEDLKECLEELEGDLICSVLDEKIKELKGYQEKLNAINSEICQNSNELKVVADKVNTAAKAIGRVVDIINKAAELIALP